MSIAEILSRVAAELALFAGAGFLIFAVNDLAVDLIYFARHLWRAAAVYSRHPRAYASYYVFNKDPGFIAILVPAWDEAAVIASMLKATLKRLDYDNYRVSSVTIATTPQPPQRLRASSISASSRLRSPPMGRPQRPIASTISTMR
jgi:adsorption protein B